MGRWNHHGRITTLDHSLFVAYWSYRAARKFGWDEHAAARGGLLHDLYLYDPADASAHPGNQCLDHPVFALRNAQALCPDLSDREANAIVSHMFPLAVHLPRSRVAIAVNLADKLCATIEVAQLYRLIPLRRRLLARVGCC